MNEQHGLIFDRLNEFFEELNQQDVAPNQEVIELYIKEIYAEVTSLNADNNPYLSRHSVLERLYNLADLTCDFAEIFSSSSRIWIHYTQKTSKKRQTLSLYHANMSDDSPVVSLPQKAAVPSPDSGFYRRSPSPSCNAPWRSLGRPSLCR